jgi:hypothetical protein
MGKMDFVFYPPPPTPTPASQMLLSVLDFDLKENVIPNLE